MPLKSFYNRNFGFIEQKMNFECYREFQARKTQLIDIIFAMKKILHNDALFHFFFLFVMPMMLYLSRFMDVKYAVKGVTSLKLQH
jgi:hypothetical protein